MTGMLGKSFRDFVRVFCPIQTDQNQISSYNYCIISYRIEAMRSMAENSSRLPLGLRSAPALRSFSASFPLSFLGWKIPEASSYDSSAFDLPADVI